MKLQEAKKWVANLDLVRPIDEKDIEDFKQWIIYNTFSPNHLGFDFISYLNVEDKEHFNLERKTFVRAIADGDIIAIHSPGGTEFFKDYQTYLVMQHNFHGLASGYCHIVPIVKVGQHVKKGEPIGTLYEQTKPKGFAAPIHLHFELGKYNGKESERNPLVEHTDPLTILPKQNNLYTKRQK